MDLILRPNPNFPVADVDENTPLEVLDSDEKFNEAAEKAAQTATQAATDESVKTAETTVETTTDPVSDTSVVETKPEDEVKKEEKVVATVEDPFAWLPDELKEKYLKDGKILGKHKSLVDLLEDYSSGESFRGKQSAEIGKLRKLTKESEDKIVSLEEQLTTLKKNADLGIKDEDLLFEEDFVPEGITQSQSVTAKEFANEETKTAFQSLLKRRGVDYPDTPEAWDELRELHKDIYEKLTAKREAVLSKAISFTRELNAIEANLPELEQSAETAAVSHLANTLTTEFQFNAKENSDEFNAFAKEGMNFISSTIGGPKEALYFQKLPSGHLLPREDALTSYLYNERKDLLRSLVQPVEEKKEEKATQEEPVDLAQENAKVLAKSIEGLDEELRKLGVEKDFSSPEVIAELQTIVNTIWEKEKGNPLYWDNGTLKPDALTQYYWVHNRSVLLDSHRKTIEESAKKTAEDRMNSFLKERQGKATGFPLSISADLAIAESKSGAEVPFPTPEQYRNSMWMINTAEKLGYKGEAGLDAFYDIIDGRIEQLPLERKRLYGF